MTHVDVRALQPGDEPAVETFLDQHADSSLFLRRNLAERGLVDGDTPYCGTWGGAFEGERIVAVAMEAARASARPVGGFIGPWAQALVAHRALGFEGAPMRVESRQHLYALSLDALVVPHTLRGGRWHCRLARAEDMDVLVDWRVGFNVESNGRTDSPELRATSREAACGHRPRCAAAGMAAPSWRARCSPHAPRACGEACSSRTRTTCRRSARTWRSASSASATSVCSS